MQVSQTNSPRPGVDRQIKPRKCAEKGCETYLDPSLVRVCGWARFCPKHSAERRNNRTRKYNASAKATTVPRVCKNCPNTITTKSISGLCAACNRKEAKIRAAKRQEQRDREERMNDKVDERLLQLRRAYMEEHKDSYWKWGSPLSGA